MRSFISISPPNDIVREIATLQKLIAATIGDDHARTLDLARADKLHLTLRFLGDMHPDQRAPLETALAAIAARHIPFSIDLGNIGVFPNLRRPAVLWLGIAANKQLASLQRDVEVAAQSVAFTSEDRAWSPHLTLARVRRSTLGSALKHLSEVIQRAQSDASISAWRANFRAESIELMRSELLPQGARYTILRSFALSEQ